MCSDLGFWADLLSKFPTLSVGIQALIVLTVPVTIIGIAYFLKEIFSVFSQRHDKYATAIEYGWEEGRYSAPHIKTLTDSRDKI
jgi:hypothetical protein